MKFFCEHRECRIEAADSLLFMAQKIPGRAQEFERDAAIAMRSSVRCQHTTRPSKDGRVTAPLPPG